MTEPDTEITYAVVYQKIGDPTWWAFTNHRFKHATGRGLSDETTDFAEADQAAADLVTGAQFTDSRPKYQYHVVATQVIQRIHMGGVIRTFGTPLPKETP